MLSSMITSQTNASMMKDNVKLELDEFVSQDKIDEAMAVINSLDFTQMNDKLENYYGWSKEDVVIWL